jgi:hypothetical protein
MSVELGYNSWEDDMNSALKRAGVLTAAGAGVVTAGWALLGAKAWLAFGRAPAADAPRDTLLDRFMPTYEIAEHHQTKVEAPATITFAAALDMDLHRSRVVQAIFRGRQLLMREPSQPRVPQSLLAETLSLGWGILAEAPGREIVVGAVCKPWQADPQFRALPPDDFAAFDTPGYAKIVWTLAVEPLTPSTAIFRTQTRVLTTDAASRGRFRRYWSAFSPGILLIRRLSLGLVKAEAERRAARQTRTSAP